jgi:ribosomal protein S3
MGQKINPISLRLQQTNKHFTSSWYSDFFYTDILKKDIYLQIYLNSLLKQLDHTSGFFFIKNTTKNIKIYLFSCNPKKSREERCFAFRLPFYQNKVLPKSPSHGFQKRMKKTTRGENNSFLQKQGFSFLEDKKSFEFITQSKRYKKKAQSLVPNEKVVFNRAKQKQLVKPAFSRCLSVSGNLSKTPDFRTHSLTMNPFLKLHSIQNKKQATLFYFFTENKTKKTWNLEKRIQTPSHQGFDFFWLNLPQYSQLLLRFFLFSCSLSSYIVKHSNLAKNRVFQKTNPESVNTLFFLHDEKQAFKNILHKLKRFTCFTKKSLFFFAIVYINAFLVFFKEQKKKALLRRINTVLRILNKKPTFRLKKQRLQLGSLSLTSRFSEKMIKNSQISSEGFFHLETGVSDESLKKRFQCFPIDSVVENTQKSKNIFQPAENKVSKNLDSLETPEHFSFKNLKKPGIGEKSLVGGVGLKKEVLQPSKNTIFSSFFRNEKTNFSKLTKNYYLLKKSTIKNHIDSVLTTSLKCSVNTSFFQIFKDTQRADFLASELVYYLQKRIPFRVLKNRIIKEVEGEKNLGIQGIRISCSGRLGGKSKKAQKAKIQTFKYGQTSLHVFSSKIDFAQKDAYTPFGKIGIKVWICYKNSSVI